MNSLASDTVTKDSITMDYAPDVHYDRVTEAWALLMGDEFHYGVFDNGDESLPDATAALTNRMIDAAQLAPGLRVLDVGCGTGAQACRLAREFGVEVVGITTSAKGVETATQRAADLGLSHLVSFELRDGTNNELPDESFDRAWVLESSHLMPERQKLLNECARVLRPGGRIALCDIVRRREIPFAELRRRLPEFAVLRAAFGEARMELLATYAQMATDAGLAVERADDLSRQTLPTLDRWITNALYHAAPVMGTLGEDGIKEFVRACVVLENLWQDGSFGYGLLAARKDG